MYYCFLRPNIQARTRIIISNTTTINIAQTGERYLTIAYRIGTKIATETMIANLLTKKRI